MSTMTATAKTPTVLESLESIFKGQAWLVANDQGDKDLAILASKIVCEHEQVLHLKKTKFDEWEARGRKACELIPMLPPIQNIVDTFPLTRTWEYIWDELIAAWHHTKNQIAKRDFAKVLLSLPTPDAPLRGKFDTVIREGFRETDGPMCVELLKQAEPTHNAVVIRKTWQTIGGNMPLKELLFANGCLHAVGTTPFGRLRTAMPYALDLVQGACFDFIDRAMKVAWSSTDLRNRLPEQFTSEGGTTVEIDNRAETVEFHWKTAHRGTRSLDDEIQYIRDDILDSAEATVREWRSVNKLVPTFHVEIYVHVMPKGWTPGTHMTAVRTVRRTIG